MGETPRWPSELAFCHWLAPGRKRKIQDKAFWEIGSQRRSSVSDAQQQSQEHCPTQSQTEAEDQDLRIIKDGN